MTDWRGKTAYHNGKKVQVGLEHAARFWPTPRANDAEKRGDFNADDPRNGLAGAVKKWPTPSVAMHKGSSEGALTRVNGKSHIMNRLDYPVELDGKNGRLNPQWVEWLMNWPLGWTSLEPMTNENWQRWKESSATYFQSNFVHEMWFDSDPSAPPQGQEPGKQRAGECGDSWPEMPQGGTHAGWDLGAGKGGAGNMQGMRPTIPTESDTPLVDLRDGVPGGMGANKRREAMEYAPRISTGVTARVDRLKALGNGQVPRVVAAAWRHLAPNAGGKAD